MMPHMFSGRNGYKAKTAEKNNNNDINEGKLHFFIK